MLESMTPRQFDEWLAMYSIEPWGDDWDQAGTIAATVHNELIRVNMFLSHKNAKKPEVHESEMYVPGKQPSRKKRYLTLDESIRASRARAGV